MAFTGQGAANQTVSVDVIGDSSDLENAMDNAGGSLLSFKQKVGALQGALGALAAYGLAKAVSAASKFQDSMVELEKVTNPKTAHEMSNAIRDMARTIPLAQTELADISAAAGRFGVRGPKNIRAFTESVSKMVTATDLTSKEAGEAFAKLAELTATPIPKVENLGSAINSLSNNFATSSSEIVESMMRSAGALSQFGLSQTEIAGFSAALNEVSESARRAGTRLRRLAQESMNPKNVKSLSKALGMTVKQFKSIRKNSPAKLFKMMAKRMKEGGKSADILKKALSTTSRQALAALGQNIKGMNRALGMSAKQFRKNTSLQKEFEIASKTLSNQVKLLQNRLRNVGISIGKVLIPPLTSLVKMLGRGVTAFSKIQRATDGLFGAFLGISSVIYGVKGAFTALGFSAGGAAGALSSALSVVTAAVWPIAALTTALTGLGLAWKRNFFGIRTTTKKILGAVKARISRFVQTVTTAWNKFTAGFRRSWAEDSKYILQLTRSFKSLFVSVFRGIGKTLLAIWRGDTKAIVKQWNRVTTSLRSAVSKGLKLVGTAFEVGMNAIIVGLESALGKIPKRWRLMLNGIGRLVNGALVSIGSQFLGLNTDVQRYTRKMWKGVRQITKAGKLSVVKSARGIRTGLIKIFKRVQSRLLKIWRGIWPLLPKPVKQITTKINNIWKRLSKRLIKQGRNATNKIKKQWKRSSPQIRKQVAQIATTIRDRLLKQYKRMGESSRGLQKTLTKLWNKTKSIVGKAWNAIKGPLKQIGKRLGYIDKQGKLTKKAITDLGLALLSIVTGPFGTAITAVYKLYRAWKTNFLNIRKTTTQVFRRVQKTVSKAISTVRSIIRKASRAVRRFWNRNIQPIIRTTRKVFRRVQKVITRSISAVQSTIRKTVAGIRRFWNKNIRPIIRTTRKIFNQIRRTIGNALNWILANAIRPILRSIKKLWRRHGDAIMREINTLWNNVKRVTNTILNVIRVVVRTAMRKIEQIIRKVMNTIGPIVRTAMRKAERFIKTAMAVIDRVIRTTMAVIERIIQATMAVIGPAVRKAFNTIEAIIKTTLDIIGRIVNTSLLALRLAWQKFGDEILAIIKFAFDAIGSAINAAFDAFLTTIRVGLNLINGDWEGAWNAIEGFTKRLLRGIANFLGKWINGFLGSIRGFINDVISFFQKLYNKLIGKSLIPRMLNGMTNAFKSFFSDIIGKLRGFVNGATQLFNDLKNAVDRKVTQLKNGATSTFNALKRGVSSTITGLKNGATSTFNSMKREVSSTIAGLKNGVTNTFNAAKDSVLTIVRSIRNRASSQFNALKNGISSTGNRIQNGLANAFNTAKDRVLAIVRSIKNRATSHISSALSSMKSAAQGWISGFTEPFNKAKNRVIDKFNSLKDQLVGSSIVPDMLEMTVGEAEDWQSQFQKPFDETGKETIQTFKSVERKLSGRFPENPAKPSPLRTATASKDGKPRKKNITVRVREISVGGGQDDPYRTGRDISRGLKDELQARNVDFK